MFGSMAGNIIGTIYYLIYQAAGIFIASRLFDEKEKGFLKIVAGSAAGSFLLHWCPVITSFIFGFTLVSHLTALILLLIIVVLIMTRTEKKKLNLTPEFLKEEPVFIGLFALTFVFFCAVLNTHTIPMQNGAMHTGQCTYGDMNMHLGFISSIAVQHTFPPDYSILPGTRLCYPFLSDSISSSVYLFGASLRWAYNLPMIFAIFQVFAGFYCFAKTWLKDTAKSVIAWILFFFNGGLGFFLYFVDFNDKTKFTRIFTEFYKTPTNLTENNIRWVNTVVDMLIPQRATLFGWAMLFTCLTVLYKAVFEKKKNYFIPIAVMIGGLPMIHTHSFMVMGFVCAGWLLYSVMDIKNEDEKTAYGKWIVPSGLVLMLVFQFIWRGNDKPDKLFIGLFAVIIIAVLCFGIKCLVKKLSAGSVKKKAADKEAKELLLTWGKLLGIVLIFALPQLLIWTFQQVSNGTFLKGQFNWVNETQNYYWFYIKNIGITAIAGAFAMMFCKKRDFGAVFPALLIWFTAEMIVFQPNFYDNNKLLYGAFALICCVTASFAVDMYRKLKIPGLKQILAAVLIFVCVVSGALSMGREFVSDYELYGVDFVDLCRYIEKNIEPDAVVLTAQNHNNAISSLTGRNIVCGTSSFLYFHGVNYQEREEDVRKMYCDTLNNAALFNKYNVGYVLVSGNERASFESLNEAVFENSFDKVYSVNGTNLYKVVRK